MTRSTRSIALRTTVALSLGAIAARTGSAQSAPALVTAPFPTHSVRHRLVPIGRTTSDTTTWTVAFRAASTGQMLQVMVATFHGRATVDSLMFDRRTLVPIWEHAVGSTSRSIAFERGHVRGEERGLTGKPHAVDVRSSEVVYSTTMDDIVTGRLPFARGYRTALHFWTGDRIETDTARVISYVVAGASSAAHWVVELHEPEAVETLWIEDASRRVIRHTYTRRSDGGRSEVVDSLAV